MDIVTLSLACAVGGLLLVAVLLAFVYSSRYKKVGPNQVLVISGRRHTVVDPVTNTHVQRSFRVVKGGGAFIWPVVERVDELSLELMTLDVVTPKVYTMQGVAVTVDGVAQVKIRGDDVSIATAAEQLLSKNTDQIKNVALQTLEGHLRAILGTMTVESIYKDRDAFATKVAEVATADMANMGMTIISFTIRDIRDDQGYLDALGMARIAEVKRDATIGQAQAERDARINAAAAQQAAREAELAAQTHIAEADKNYQVQKANYDADVNRQKAQAELAYVLQQNITNQQVKAEEVQVQVIEKQKQIQVQEQEVARRERELEATVRKPAEAEQYRIQTLASAKKYQLTTEAEGQASAMSSVGEGEASANKAKGLANADIIKATGLGEAEAVKAKGLAQAEVIQAQGFAEAEAMQKKAAAWQNYNEAAIIQNLVDKMPAIAEAISKPLAQTDRIVVISNGGGDGAGAGASKITQDITNIVAQVPATVEALTGVDIVGGIRNLPTFRKLSGRSDDKDAKPG
ncbi:MAG: flotillin family protein [Chloroflexi bacterium]|nr:flotillin family protein [Chloroflexota bacterium]